MKPRPPGHSATVIGWLPVPLLPLAALALFNVVQPWILMWCLAISIYAGLKWLTWWKARSNIPHKAWRSVAYLFAWPGMDAESFLDETRRPASPGLQRWLVAGAETIIGIVLIWVIARALPPGHPLLRGWVGMLGLIFLLHFGIFQLAALFWQSCGVDAPAIMSAPLRSRSLSEFWGRRWNLGFRQLAHELVFSPLHGSVGVGTAGLLVFVFSGLIHDLVISVPARGGYGLPTAYFILQGIGVAVERSRFGRRYALRGGISGRLFAALLTLGPVFWLFHPPFVLRVIIPFMKAIHAR